MMRLSKIVSVAELDLLIAGMPSIDLDDWQEHTMYMGFFSKDSPEAKWFWQILREDFGSAEHAKLLHFTTGSASVPGTGFSTLSGYGGGTCRFTIEGRVDQGPEHLPTAATCFNRLRMPRYGSRDEMAARLKVAIMGVQVRSLGICPCLPAGSRVGVDTRWGALCCEMCGAGMTLRLDKVLA
jgi:E3 ubiquitin-protein ligase HUWE1